MEINETEVVDERGLDAAQELPIALYRVDLTVEWADGRRRAHFSTLRSVDLFWQERRTQMGGGPRP